MKKLVSLVLSLCLLMSLCSFAAAEEKKVIKVWNDFGDNASKEFDVWGVPINNFAIFGAGLEEFAAKNNATWVSAGKGLANLHAAIASGEELDLIISYNTFPNIAAQGAAMAMKEEDEKYFAEKYGATYTDLMNFGGDCYGIAVPFGGTGLLYYNRTKLEDLGIKTPKEYYLEGNWNYQTFFQYLNDCTMDADGDGKFDYAGIGKFSHAYFFCPVLEDSENGYVSLMNTDRVREYVQLYYEAYQTGAVQNSGYGLDGTNPYVLNKPVQSYPYMVSFMMYTDANGDIIDCCPVPAWKEGEKASSSLNYVYMLIPANCADYDQAIRMMDFIMECALEDMDALSYSDIFDYEGLTGCTEWTKSFLENRYAKRDELDAATKALPEYDAEWITTINEHLKNNVYHMQIVASGIDWDPWNNATTFGIMWEAPSATSIAQVYPVHQAQCDAFNMLYLGGIE